jgi:hypothetical protein
MQDQEVEALRGAIAALETQRATLGDTALELAAAPLRARLAGMLRPAGLQHRHWGGRERRCAWKPARTQTRSH